MTALNILQHLEAVVLSKRRQYSQAGDRRLCAMFEHCTHKLWRHPIHQLETISGAHAEFNSKGRPTALFLHDTFKEMPCMPCCLPKISLDFAVKNHLASKVSHLLHVLLVQERSFVHQNSDGDSVTLKSAFVELQQSCMLHRCNNCTCNCRPSTAADFCHRFCFGCIKSQKLNANSLEQKFEVLGLSKRRYTHHDS